MICSAQDQLHLLTRDDNGEFASIPYTVLALYHSDRPLDTYTHCTSGENGTRYPRAKAPETRPYLAKDISDRTVWHAVLGASCRWSLQYPMCVECVVYQLTHFFFCIWQSRTHDKNSAKPLRYERQQILQRLTYKPLHPIPSSCPFIYFRRNNYGETRLCERSPALRDKTRVGLTYEVDNFHTHCAYMKTCFHNKGNILGEKSIGRRKHALFRRLIFSVRLPYGA